MTHQDLVDIAQCGVHAPSADNEHVFRLEIEDALIRLWPTDEFKSSSEPHRRVLGLMSLGAVVENMRLRARRLGFSTRIDWSLADSAGAIAQLNFTSDSGAGDDALADAIFNRHTNRRMYRGHKLSAQERAQFSDAIEACPGVRLTWLEGPKRTRALELIWHAESERFRRERLHAELFASIRFDLSWKQAADHALSPGALEVETPMRPLFKALRNWSVMRPLTWIGAHRLLGLRAGWLPCWQSPMLGLLTTSVPLAPTEKVAIECGTAFERLWLHATSVGMSMQPMAASTVLPLLPSDEKWVAEDTRSKLVAGWQSIVPREHPAMVFRLGWAAAPTVVSGRRPIGAYMLKK